ncbi:MAG: hypothetical protein ACYTHJ_14080 [Planctomycetota bacterium]|jgi:hypothetical protein
MTDPSDQHPPDTHGPDPDNLLYLYSMGLDEELNKKDQARLDDALKADESLNKDADALAAVDRWMRQVATERQEVDSSTFVNLVNATLEDDDSESLACIDRLVSAWGSEKVEVDPIEFRDGVLARLDGVRHVRKRSLVFRLAVPLAAAAALAFAIIAQFPSGFAQSARNVVTFASLATVGTEDQQGRVRQNRVAYAAKSKTVVFGENPARRVAVVTISTGVRDSSYGEYPPL